MSCAFVELLDLLCGGGLVEEISIVDVGQRWRSMTYREQIAALRSLAQMPTEDLARLAQIFTRTSLQLAGNARA